MKEQKMADAPNVIPNFWKDQLPLLWQQGAEAGA